MGVNGRRKENNRAEAMHGDSKLDIPPPMSLKCECGYGVWHCYRSSPIVYFGRVLGLLPFTLWLAFLGISHSTLFFLSPSFDKPHHLVSVSFQRVHGQWRWPSGTRTETCSQFTGFVLPLVGAGVKEFACPNQVAQRMVARHVLGRSVCVC